MKRIYQTIQTLALLIATAATANAQITITQADISGTGTTVLNAVVDNIPANSISVGGTGAQTWDFSSLQLTSFDTLNFVDPATTPYGNLFGSANTALQSSATDGYTYIDLNASSMSIVGLGGYDINSNGVTLTANLQIEPASTILEFPSTLGTSFTTNSATDSTLEDTFTGQFDSLRIRRRFITNSTFDAYGDCTTPAGTYTTIRQFNTEITIDSIWGYNALFNIWIPVQQEYDTTYRYLWLANGEDYFVCELRTDVPGGFATNGNFKVGNNVLAYATIAENPSCNGDCDGTITATAVGGTGTYTFAWDAAANNATTASVSGLCDGTYTVTVSDGASNTTLTVTLNEPDVLVATNTVVNETAVGGDGSIDLTVTGGTAPYFYTWSNGATSQDIAQLSGGTYTVTVVDAYACSTLDTAVVGGSVSVTEINDATSSISVYPNPVESNVYVLTTEKIEVYQITDISGKEVYREVLPQYNFINMSGLKPGVYVLRIKTDQNIYMKRLEKR